MLGQRKSIRSKSERMLHAERRNRLEQKSRDRYNHGLRRLQERISNTVDRDKKELRKTLKPLRRTTGYSDEGIPPKPDDMTRVRESPIYRNTFKLSERQLNHWKVTEKSLVKQQILSSPDSDSHDASDGELENFFRELQMSQSEQQEIPREVEQLDTQQNNGAPRKSSVDVFQSLRNDYKRSTSSLGSSSTSLENDDVFESEDEFSLADWQKQMYKKYTSSTCNMQSTCTRQKSTRRFRLASAKRTPVLSAKQLQQRWSKMTEDEPEKEHTSVVERRLRASTSIGFREHTKPKRRIRPSTAKFRSTKTVYTRTHEMKRNISVKSTAETIMTDEDVGVISDDNFSEDRQEMLASSPVEHDANNNEPKRRLGVITNNFMLQKADDVSTAQPTVPTRRFSTVSRSSVSSDQQKFTHANPYQRQTSGEVNPRRVSFAMSSTSSINGSTGRKSSTQSEAEKSLPKWQKDLFRDGNSSASSPRSFKTLAFMVLAFSRKKRMQNLEKLQEEEETSGDRLRVIQEERVEKTQRKISRLMEAVRKTSIKV